MKISIKVIILPINSPTYLDPKVHPQAIPNIFPLPLSRFSMPSRPPLSTIPIKTLFLMSPQTFQRAHPPSTPHTLHSPPIATHLTEHSPGFPPILIRPAASRLQITQRRQLHQPLHLPHTRQIRHARHKQRIGISRVRFRGRQRAHKRREC